MVDPVTPAGRVPAAARSRARFLPFEMSEAWVRFLLAIVGLLLAFGAALFSTVAREAGSLWGTLVFSSVAQLLLAHVGAAWLCRTGTADPVESGYSRDPASK